MNGNPQLNDQLFRMKPEQIVEYCKINGERFVQEEVTSSQLRNVFSKIVSIRTFYNTQYSKFENPKSFFEKIKRDIVLLKPKLAYSANKLKSFQSEMIKLIDITVNSIEQELNQNQEGTFKLKSLDNFFTIVEGFIAYHKFYGGK